MEYLIYTLSDPKTDELRYVGKTSMSLEERLKHHIWPSSLKEKTYRANWISSLMAKGLKPKIELLEEHKTQSELDEAEIFYIEYFRAIGFRLVNTSNGGDGWSKGQKRGAMSDEGKLKRSLSAKGKKKPPRTREHTLNNSRAQGGRPFTDQFGTIYQTKNEAARILGVVKGSIDNVLNGRSHTVKGMTLNYIKEIK